MLSSFVITIRDVHNRGGGFSEPIKEDVRLDYLLIYVLRADALAHSIGPSTVDEDLYNHRNRGSLL